MSAPHYTTHSICRLCHGPMGGSGAGAAIELGMLPVCNAFSTQGTAVRHPLALAACQACGLVQLTALPVAEAVVPQVPWIRYNEPGGHLDDVGQRLLSLLPVRQHGGTAIGVGPFDQPLLDRLSAGAMEIRLLDLTSGAAGTGYPYLETIQAGLNGLGQLAARDGRGDIVLCRYLLEHSTAPLEALKGLAALTAADGLLLIEVPDSSKFLQRKDYSFIWEEHVCYFTEATIRRLVRTAGFELVELLRYPGLLEDALVLILRPHARLSAAATDFDRPETAQFTAFADALSGLRAAWGTSLDELAGDGKIALFGAGHQAVMFANALGLQDRIAVMVDDDANKQGCIPPGLSTPVISSADMLKDTTITLCLMAVNPLVQSKIRDKCRALLDRGGRMLSIFPRGEGDTPMEVVPSGLIRKSAEVFLAPGPVASVTAESVDFLKRALLVSPRGRVRINLHDNPDNLLHEMIIAIQPQSYIRPHKHPGKSESFHILDGAVDIVVFDDAGKIVQVVPLAAAGKAGAGYCYRMSEPMFHTLVIHSDMLIVHEITNGPFVQDGAIFADFAPEEADGEAASAYAAGVRTRAAAFRGAPA